MTLALLTAALVIAVGSRGTADILRAAAWLTREARRLEETRRQAALDEDDRRRAAAPGGGVKKAVGFRP